MKINDLHTTTLEKFPLKWRWTDPKYCQPNENELALIEPLDKESANTVWAKSVIFDGKKNDFSPNRDKFPHIELVETDGEQNVKQWLIGRIPSGKVIVSWGPNVAVLTQASLFIKYWEDFCYPSSDDVSIWPEDESWVLHYWHEEVFWYGKAISA